MSITISELMDFAENLAPFALAEEWDHVGLQVGSPQDSVEHILVALEPRTILDAGLQFERCAAVVHHPLLFRPLEAVRLDGWTGRALKTLLERQVSLLAMHTNLDKAEFGINHALAGLLGLNTIGMLLPDEREEMVKLVVYVPPEAEESVRRAMTGAGAGVIGHYSEATFRVLGRGTFRPGPDTSPYSGQSGNLSEVEEYRLEAILPRAILDRVVTEVRRAHPYEEMAYDAIPLLNHRVATGLGLVGELPRKMELSEFARHVEERLGEPARRSVDNRIVRRVAVVGGSGRAAIRAAARKADVLVTGDLGHHDFLLAEELGLALVDAGHRATEEPGVRALAERIAGFFGSRVETVYLPTPSPWSR